MKQMELATCIYLLMEITCWLHVVFVLIFMIYLFTYSKRCQQQQRKSPPVFIYLCKLLLVTHCFRFNIQYLFVYLFKVMSTKAAGTHHLFLFTYANRLLITCGFRFNIEYILFIYSKPCQQQQHKSPPVFIYLCKLLVDYMWFSF